jgi:hypothetical protein
MKLCRREGQNKIGNRINWWDVKMREETQGNWDI